MQALGDGWRCPFTTATQRHEVMTMTGRPGLACGRVLRRREAGGVSGYFLGSSDTRRGRS
jgi:hypothetical protein